MISQKKTVYNKLKTLKTQEIVKQVCEEGSQTWSKMPCVTYMEINNSPGEFADDEEYASALAVKVDSWGNSSEEIESISIQVTGLMEELGYQRTLFVDVPDLSSKIKHKTMRFEKSEVLESNEILEMEESK